MPALHVRAVEPVHISVFHHILHDTRRCSYGDFGVAPRPPLALTVSWSFLPIYVEQRVNQHLLPSCLTAYASSEHHVLSVPCAAHYLDHY